MLGLIGKQEAKDNYHAGYRKDNGKAKVRGESPEGAHELPRRRNLMSPLSGKQVIPGSELTSKVLGTILKQKRSFCISDFK